MGVHNPREYQHVDLGGLGSQKRMCTGAYGGPRGQDVVDQDHPAPGNIGFTVGRDLERALAQNNPKPAVEPTRRLGWSDE